MNFPEHFPVLTTARLVLRETADHDVDAVFDKYWLPVLDEITAPREIPALKLAA